MITQATDPNPALPQTIWYMGVKTRVLDNFLDLVLQDNVPRGGTVLDLFSGTGVVSAYCSQHFRTLSNDSQLYSKVLASAFIEHEPSNKDQFLDSLNFEEDLKRAFESNQNQLQSLFEPELEKERVCLEAFSWEREKGRRLGLSADIGAIETYREFLSENRVLYGNSVDRSPNSELKKAWQLVGEKSLDEYRSKVHQAPAVLVTAYYAHIYFSLRQAIAIDSLRNAIFKLEKTEDPVLIRKAQHYLACLLHVASVSTSGTSHFAQPRHLNKDSEIRSLAKRRSLDILEGFLETSSNLKSYLGSIDIQTGNRSFRGDYRSLIEDSSSGPRYKEEAQSDLVYMDPPYTSDNYSRFYHVLEVLAAYDYPKLQRDKQGEVLRGRYPQIEQRFQSGFCSTSKVEQEFTYALSAAARSGARSVISYSYPTGLLLKLYSKKQQDPLEELKRLCGQFYKDVELHKRSMMHSGQGDRNLAIDEILLVGKGSRLK